MRLGRRLELLLAVAGRRIPEPRRKELLDRASRWMESPDCPAKSHEELFWMWGAQAMIQMANYCEDLQAEWGAEILEREMHQPQPGAGAAQT